MQKAPSGFRLLTTLGGLIVVYGVVVLGYVATAPDIRLRVPATETSATPDGIQVYVADGAILANGSIPRSITLTEMADRPTRNFLEFASTLRSLGKQRIPAAGIIDAGATPAGNGSDDLPGIVEEFETETRWVRIKYHNNSTTTPTSAWIQVQSLPLGDLGQSLIWFVLQLGILAIASVAYWHRSFDLSARLFFAMCIVSLGGYISGLHWWVISANSLLIPPFIITATLIPAVTLHFFLSYPRLPAPLQQHPVISRAALYAAPACFASWFLLMNAWARWLHFTNGSPEAIDKLHSSISTGLLIYIGIAAAYYIATLTTLAWRYFRGNLPAIERHQIRWFLWAGVIASILITYALWPFGNEDERGLAVGSTSPPILAASLCFLIAYIVGMIRYRLMLLDQIISKGTLYYVVSVAATGGFAAVFALGSLVSDALIPRKTPTQLLAWVSLLILSASLLLWLRDRVQRLIDQQFYREKYQLDKALRRVNNAAASLTSPETVADMLLGTCLEVLQVDIAAIYLRRTEDGPHTMLASRGDRELPLQLAAAPEIIASLKDRGTVLRTIATTRDTMSVIQRLLWDTDTVVARMIETADGSPGVLLLGKKPNAAAFTAEDLTFLNAICQVTNVAFQGARLRQNLDRINEELQLKNERLTEQSQQVAMLKSELQSLQTANLGSPTEQTSGSDEPFDRGDIRGHSPALLRVVETARKVTASDATVLIRGESGTGKELLAKVLHRNSPRNSAPLISVHCASLSPTLLESELFGHVKGAFTGATEDKVGRFQAAENGTLFLDEIGDITLETQIKLLRVLQEREFEPVGSGQTIKANVRIIAATNRHLEKMISDGEFREDLFYRLNVIPIVLPPLRERPEDLVELALHFIRETSKKAGRPEIPLGAETLLCLERYHWPGNIRELQNVIERAIVMADGDKITVGDLPAEIVRAARFTPVFHSKATTTGIPSLDDTPLPRLTPKGEEDEPSERVRLLEALEAAAGNKAEAARRLGMPRSTYFSKLKKYGLA